MMKLLVLLLTLLVLTPLACAAAGDAPADPYAAASEKVRLDLYRPAEMPEGYVLGSVQLITDPSDVLIATYYSADESQVHIMETTRDGLECEDCATIDIGGVAAPYSREENPDGTALVDVTVFRGGTGIIIGLRQKNLDTTKALLVLRPIAEKLVKVERGAAMPEQGKLSALKEAAGRASFPLYAPNDLPQYFYLKTVAYSPPALAEHGELATPEQVAITYASTNKQITVLVQPPDAFSLDASEGRQKVTVRGWQGVAWREGKQASLALDTTDAMILLTGNVQQSTLVSAARSLSRVR